MTIIEAARQASRPGAIRRAAWENEAFGQRWARYRSTHDRDFYVEDWLVGEVWATQNVYALLSFTREDLLAEDWEVKE